MKKITLLISAFMLTVTTTFAQTWNIGYPNETNVTATLSNGILTISGTGAMMDFSPSEDPDPEDWDWYWEEINTPWYANRTTITSLIIDKGITRIGNFAFTDLSEITSVTIPENITFIGGAAFIGCASLFTVNYNAEDCFIDGFNFLVFWNTPIQTLNIGNNVKTIPGYLFCYCKNLTSVIIPDNVERIGSEAFADCINLRSVTIGKKCSYIGSWAFADCTELSTLTNLNPTPQNISNNVFDGITNRSSITLHVPFGTKDAYEATNVWKDFDIVDDVDKMDVIVIKGGVIVFQSAVSAIDSVIFYNPVNPIAAPSMDALFIHRVDDASYDELLLDDIRQFILSDVDLLVEMWNSKSLLYDINDKIGRASCRERV